MTNSENIKELGTEREICAKSNGYTRSAWRLSYTTNLEKKRREDLGPRYATRRISNPSVL
jgi:hypothetical protein